MARKITPSQLAMKPAKNSGLTLPGKTKRGRIGTAGKPRKAVADRKKAAKPVALAQTIANTETGKKRRLYKFDLLANATSLSQAIGVGLAAIAFLAIVTAVVMHAYNNRPSHAKALAQVSEYEKATQTCGKKPYLVVTNINQHNEQRTDYYTPGFESYDTRVKEPPADQSESKRFDCVLDGALIAYATPHYSPAERAEVAKAYKDYATSKGMKFLAPSHLPAGYSLVRQTLSSSTYTVAYTATGNESIDGFFTTCSLLRDAPDRSVINSYRTAEKTLGKVGSITLYGNRITTIDNQEQAVVRHAETAGMWCSFTNNGERLIANEEITAIMGSFASHADDIALQATPVAND